MTSVYTRGGLTTAILTTALVWLIIGMAIGKGAFEIFREWQTLIAALIALAAAGSIPRRPDGRLILKPAEDGRPPSWAFDWSDQTLAACRRRPSCPVRS